MTDHSKAIAAIEERRHAAANVVLTKDNDPTPFTKADGETGEFNGYGSNFWVVDSTAEVTAPGTFQKSLTERGPDSARNRMFVRYEHETTVGAYKSIKESDTGLWSEGMIVDDGLFGTAVRAHLKANVPYGLSIGYRTISSRPAEAGDPLILDHAPPYVIDMVEKDGPSAVRVLTEVKLLEISIVTFPSVDVSLVDGYKSVLDLTQRALDRLMADVKAGRLTDDHITHLRQIATGLPAGTTPDADEMSGAPRIPQTVTVHRNYSAEARLALICAGVPIEGFAL